MDKNTAVSAINSLPPVNSLPVNDSAISHTPDMINAGTINANNSLTSTPSSAQNPLAPSVVATNTNSNTSDNQDANNRSQTGDDSVLNRDVNTKIACLNCREKKLKCDKLLPACTRCIKKNCRCIYIEHKKTGPKPHLSLQRSKKIASETPETPNTAPKPKKQKITASAPSTAPVSNQEHHDQPPFQPPFTPKSSSLSLPPILSLPAISQQLHMNQSPPQTAILQHPYPYQDQSASRLSVDSFMNPLTYNQPLVQNSTTNLRNNVDGTHSPLSISRPMDISPSTTSSATPRNATPTSTSDSNHILLANKQHMKHQPATNNHLNPMKPKTEHFNTNLTNLTNKSFEEIIGLPQLNLKMQDIDKFHSFYFNSSTRIFKYSIQRYYNTFVKEPKSILHYSYMIWTMACFYLDEYEYMVEDMYKTALVQMTNYWESNRDSFHSDILTYLHALCLKSQFEFLSGREMRAALTIASSIRLTQMYGYDQIDLSPTTLGTPAIFFRSFSVNSEHFESTNTLLQDDNLDPDIPLVEERRRVLWEVFAIDKWSSLVTGLPCALSVDSLSVIFTKLPSPTTFLPLNNDSDITEPEHEQSSYYLHEAMQKLDNNQVLLDINSSSSKILLLTISENIIKWCKMFLNMVELETLKNRASIDSIRNKVDELVRNFESMHNNLLFFDLTTEPLMNIVITNTSTLLYQSVLIKFGSLFDLQFKEDPSGANICENEITLFKDILYEVSSMSERLVLRFIKKQHIEIHLKKAPVFIVFINSIKSLFQCIAFIYRFNHILQVSQDRKNSLIETIKSCATIINGMTAKTPIVEKTKNIINNGQELLDHSPHSLSFFDSFFDSAKTY